MTSTATLAGTPATAASLQQLAPDITPKVKDGDLKTAQTGLMVAGVALTVLGYFLGHHAVSYLVGYMGVIGICLGALFFTMIQHITRAGWSVSVRRVTENIAGTLPFMLVLFIPIVVGFDEIYHHWTSDTVNITDKTADNYDAVLAGKSGFLNSTFFFVRVAIYFAIWIGLALYFRGQSIKQDESGDPSISMRMSQVAAPGLLLFALSLTFAAFDWVMSIDPHWFSTIFGVAFFAGAVMASLAFTICLIMWLQKKGYYTTAITKEHFHDLGKLMWAFMLFWTYTNFSQYMLIWYANLPEETAWYDLRTHGGWGAVGPILIVGHFLFPFVFLMSRNMKRHRVALPAGAIFLMAIHCIDMQYLILPSALSGHDHGDHGGDGGVVSTAADTAGEHADGFGAQIGQYLTADKFGDFACFFGLLFLVAGLTIMNVRRSNLIPLRDPRLRESLNFHNV